MLRRAVVLPEGTPIFKMNNVFATGNFFGEGASNAVKRDGCKQSKKSDKEKE